MWEKIAVIVQPHVVYCTVCKAVDGMHFVRDLVGIVTKLNRILTALWVTGIIELLGLTCTWNSETFLYVPSPMVKKPCYLNHLKFLAWIGTSSETDIRAQAVGARELKLIEDFPGIQRDGLRFTAARCSGMLFQIIQN